MKQSILNFTKQELEKNFFFEKNYQIDQIFNSIYKNLIFDFNNMSNLPKSLREELNNNYNILSLSEEKQYKSIDGSIKYLFKLFDSNFIESVFLKDKNNRVTFCISTQVGCKMGCLFCKTAKMGYIRNLDTSEILSQILYIINQYSYNNPDNKGINIVFMGMGEPLDNFENLVKSIKILTDKKYLNISPTRITVSTCGIIEKIDLLFKEFPTIRVAISLNSLIQHKREKIMPVAKKYKINDLINILENYYKIYKNRITLEYVLIKNFNNNDEDIDAFDIINNKKGFHINIIPLNNVIENLTRPSEKEIKTFMQKLKAKGYNVTRRYRRGYDISADCGQLYWDSRT